MDIKTRRKALRMLPHGLQVVTVRDGEEYHGYTSSWMTQVSFDPPLVVLGVKADTTSRRMMKKEGVFCAHFLKKDQQEIAERFFKPARRSGNKLSDLDFTIGELTGCPILTDTLAHLECRVVHEWEGGDHDVVVAEVLDAVVHSDGEALLMSDTPWNYGG